MQIYHSNATTNIHIRQQIQSNSNCSVKDLAQKHNISTQTVSKWKHRASLEDASCAPLNISYALSQTERSLIVALRKSTWLPLDEIYEMLLEQNPNISRSSVYRCFVREYINKVPEEKREKAKKFKAYSPGFLHMDVTYLPKFKGEKSYLYVAIDRATRSMLYWVYKRKTASNTEDFMDRCLHFFPFKITHILTDNGLEFTNRLLISKKGDPCSKPSKMDIKCQEENIEHRLTKPSTPKTNGMVERVNGTIKSNTILKNDYKSSQEMKIDLMNFMYGYNLYRRHGSLRKELKVKTPVQAIEKWYELEPDIFKVTPNEFKNKLINLQSELNQLHQQPCET
jgi:transposase-like protein